MTPQPLFVLGSPYGEVSRVAAMLGAHPRAALMPELALTLTDRVETLLDTLDLGGGHLGDGLFRAIAEIFYGAQTEDSLRMARLWLERRADWSTTDVIWAIAERIAPHQLIIPDTLSAWRPDYLLRLQRQFPDARWLHVLRHPRLFGSAAVAALRDRLFVPPDFKDHATDPPRIDPQLPWFRVHTQLATAAAQRAAGLAYTLRAEDLLAQHEAMLTELTAWLGWPIDEAALAAMQHPEHSPFAAYGPPGAVLGLDEAFIEFPSFEPRLRPVADMYSPLAWRRDGQSFCVEVRELAGQFGYH